MSTRYVYELYNTTVAERVRASEITLNATALYPEIEAILCNSYTSSVAKNRQGTPVTRYKPSGNYVTGGFLNYNAAGSYYQKTYDTSAYKYVIVCARDYVSETEELVDQCYLLEFSPSFSGGFWHIDDGSKSNTFSIWNNDSSIAANKYDLKEFYKSGGTIGKGSTLQRTQSSNTTLTTGAVKESGVFRWRTYKGSDNIDPTAVNYVQKDIYGNAPVTISLTPKELTYGGTISYQYQYSINSGSTWVNIGSKTTDTTNTVIVPEEAEQFQARVLASDSWGFTSTTYVYGPDRGVSLLKAFATVSGKNQKAIKLFPIVNGKVATAKKGYVIVSGIVRKFL